MGSHPGEAGVCNIHGTYDEYCGPCKEAKETKKVKIKADADPYMAAAEVVVKAKFNDKYEIVGLGESEDIFGIWEVDVREKERPRTKIETINVQVSLLDKIIEEHLTVDHLTGKKPMPEQIRADIKEQFDSMGDMFEGRE